VAECLVCHCIKNREFVIYENSALAVLIHPSPAVAGHLMIVPKEHFPIVESVPDAIIKEMMVVSAKMSVLLFEALQAQGTNTLWLNGAPAHQQFNHAALHVIPRKENDNLMLSWAPKQLSDDEMSTAELKLKEGSKEVGIPEPKKVVPVEVKKAETAKEDDWRLKYLNRIP